MLGLAKLVTRLARSRTRLVKARARSLTIIFKMTCLGEIGKIYRDSVENLRENMNLRSKF